MLSMKTDHGDHEGNIGGGTSYNVPPSNERCVARHAPSGPSSLALINLVGGLGYCNAQQAPPSEPISTSYRTFLWSAGEFENITATQFHI